MNSEGIRDRQSAGPRCVIRIASVVAGAAMMLTSLMPRLTAAPPSSTGRWLHVKVEGKSAANPELVRVNVPLELAEKVLPAIHAENLQHGKIKLNGRVGEIDLPVLLEAVRNASDGEFVTVHDRHDHVRVAKSEGFLVVKVQEDSGKHGKAQQVDIRVPFTVAEALLSGGNQELDLAAAVRALQASGDTELVNVEDQDETVRIWVDSRSAAE